MKQSYRTKAGFSAVEGLLVLVVVGALVFVGYTFMQKNAESNSLQPAENTTQSAKVTASDKELQDAVLLPNDLSDNKASDAEMKATAQADGGYNEATN